MTPILDFISKNLGDDFSSRVVWESVKKHHHKDRFSEGAYRCYPCQSQVYPCDRLREVAAYFSDQEDYDESWTPREKRGKVQP